MPSPYSPSADAHIADSFSTASRFLIELRRLLLHEGRSVIYVARQLGHDARLTISTYGHVIDEIEDMPQLDAQTAIAESRARIGWTTRIRTLAAITRTLGPCR
jgi:hypothetical protein